MNIETWIQDRDEDVCYNDRSRRLVPKVTEWWAYIITDRLNEVIADTTDGPWETSEDDAISAAKAVIMENRQWKSSLKKHRSAE